MTSTQSLNLSTSHFNPPVTGHPPTGTVPSEILPDGVQKPKLFTSLKIHPYSTDSLELKNRVVVSPMCQYSVVDGFPTPYHIAHLGSFALHGAGTVMVEASLVSFSHSILRDIERQRSKHTSEASSPNKLAYALSLPHPYLSGIRPEGRITPQDMGIYKDEHIAAHASLIQAIKSFSPGLVMGIQLAHAGRKGSDHSPFFRGEKKHKWVTKEDGGWPDDVRAPSAISWGEGWVVPKALTIDQIKEVEDDFVEAARRAFKAGYDFVELHSAHGYLLHSFLSPLSNIREDNYGGSFENRTRLHLDIVKRIRKEFPDKGLWFRISSTDFAEHLHEEGKKTWDIEETKKLAKLLDSAGVDVLDCSAGGNVEYQRIKPEPGYQLGFAAEVKKLGLKMHVGSVGMMEGPDPRHPGHLAEEALQQNKTDLVLLARGLMAHPTFAEDAAVELMGIRPAGNPQYHRGEYRESFLPRCCGWLDLMLPFALQHRIPIAVHPAKVPPPRPQNSN